MSSKKANEKLEEKKIQAEKSLERIYKYVLTNTNEPYTVEKAEQFKVRKGKTEGKKEEKENEETPKRRRGKNGGGKGGKRDEVVLFNNTCTCEYF